MITPRQAFLTLEYDGKDISSDIRKDVENFTWLACIFMVVGLVVTALAAVRLGYGLVVAKTVYKWIVNAEENFGSGAGAEKKAHVIAVLRGYTPDWLDWAINERTLDWIVQLVFDFTKKKLEDYMAKKSAETTTVAHFGNVGENKRND